MGSSEKTFYIPLKQRWDAATKWLKKQSYMQLTDVKVQEVKRYGQKGYSLKDAVPKEVKYYLIGGLATDLQLIKRSCFLY